MNAQPDTKLCPECGAAMQIKNGRRGKFWGCTNFRRIHEVCGQNEKLAKQIETKAVKKITDTHNEVIDNMRSEKMSEAEILEQFKDVGTPREPTFGEWLDENNKKE